MRVRIFVQHPIQSVSTSSFVFFIHLFIYIVLKNLRHRYRMVHSFKLVNYLLPSFLDPWLCFICLVHEAFFCAFSFYICFSIFAINCLLHAPEINTRFGHLIYRRKRCYCYSEHLLSLNDTNVCTRNLTKTKERKWRIETEREGKKASRRCRISARLKEWLQYIVCLLSLSFCFDPIFISKE